ncbi:response regulator [Paenibacillaceae bacterium WGS1546]|uniref:response regulator transcription factor n=1 Tax=Cohnella sp. WGS1546 TaxID=3366810 RepID=UPI00372D3037
MYKIVIADDEYQAREGLVAQLAAYGEEWTVVGAAKNGQEAVELVVLHRPDILITDISMPGFTGIDVMKKLREIEADTTVIILSGYAEFQYAQEAVACGAFEYMLKPAPHREIADSIRRAARMRNNRQAFAPQGPQAQSAYRSPVKYALEQIHSYYYQDISLKEIADRQGMNADYFSTLFRSEVGATFSDYLATYRIGQAKKLLKELDMKVYEVSVKVGYKDYKYFAKLFKQVVGVSPLAFKKG